MQVQAISGQPLVDLRFQLAIRHINEGGAGLKKVLAKSW